MKWPVFARAHLLLMLGVMFIAKGSDPDRSFVSASVALLIGSFAFSYGMDRLREWVRSNDD